MTVTLRTALPIAGLAAALVALPAALSSAAPFGSHGVEAVPLVPASPSPRADDLEIVPLVPPKPTAPAVDDLEIVPLVPKKPPPMIEIIRWKKKKVTRPRYPDYTSRQQTFNAYLAGEQSAILRWSIDVEAAPGLCNRAGYATVVYFASTRPVLVSAARRSISIGSFPVTINFASSVSHNPDRESCLTLQPSTACRLDAQGLPGTATISTRGNGTATRSVYLSSLTIDERRAGSTCVSGLFGFPEILGLGSGDEDARIPWAVVNSRSQQNVNLGRVYGTAGNQSSPGTTCSHEATGYACSFASTTRWNLRLVRATQKQIAGLR